MKDLKSNKKPPNTGIRNLQEFTSYFGKKRIVRNYFRDYSISMLSLMYSVPQNVNWIRFPFYHHVFDDERCGFDAHLQFMRNIGDFVSMDEAISLLELKQPLKGRYFCITFDDGFKNNITNAMPILNKYEVKATFFVPTKYVGSSFDEDYELCSTFYSGYQVPMDFLSWEDCKELVRHGMTVGSHTVNHINLIDMPKLEVESELSQSKKEIEEKLGQPCLHFCAPNGIPNVHFDASRDPVIARKIGYKSFHTTRRGSAYRKSAPMLVEREHFIARWKTYQLRYFLSK